MVCQSSTNSRISVHRLANVNRNHCHGVYYSTLSGQSLSLIRLLCRATQLDQDIRAMGRRQVVSQIHTTSHSLMQDQVMLDSLGFLFLDPTILTGISAKLQRLQWFVSSKASSSELAEQRSHGCSHCTFRITA